jgi:formylglycine-generating enzyme
LQNGQRNGDTESGTYAITEGGPNSGTVVVPDAATRAAWSISGPHWALPSQDEWYKAAYYDPNKPGGAGYWNYPTKTDSVPSNIGSDNYTDPGNHANYKMISTYTLGSPYYRTNVGEFEKSASPYGTFDQGGNVDEFHDTISSGNNYGARGGNFDYSYGGMDAASWSYSISGYESRGIGFRVALIPEPGTLILLASGAIAAFIFRRCRK